MVPVGEIEIVPGETVTLEPGGLHAMLMAAVTHVTTLACVAQLLGEDLELLEAIVENDDNLTYGSIVSVQTGQDDYVPALTDDGIYELKDMLA